MWAPSFFTRKVLCMGPKRFKIKLAVDPLEVSNRLTNAFDQIEKRLIGRSSVLKCAKLALLTKSHLMLVGPPGTAKSKLAKLVFQTVSAGDKSVIYSHQFMPNTQAEEVLGPVNPRRLRETGEWVYNTAGMLPEAHFAYLDELYRAPDAVLPTMMGILNEREFHYGGTSKRCPLISAIATTNFMTANEALEAFHDRWLMSLKVTPLDSAEHRLAMMGLFLDRSKSDDAVVNDPLSLAELKVLQDAIEKVQVHDELRAAFDDVISGYARATNAEITDRRYCELTRLVQAEIFLNERHTVADPFFDALAVIQYGLIRGDESDVMQKSQAFLTALSQATSVRARASDEDKEISQFEESAERYMKNYDPSKPREKLLRQLERVSEILDRITNLAPEEQFTIKTNQERLGKVIDTFATLQKSLQHDLGLTVTT